MSSFNYHFKITGRLLNQVIMYGSTGGKYIFTDHTFLIEGFRCQYDYHYSHTGIPLVTPTTRSLE